MNIEERAFGYEQRLRARTPGSREGRIKLLGRARFHEHQLDRQRGRRRFEVFGQFFSAPDWAACRGSTRPLTRLSREIDSLSSSSSLALCSTDIEERPVTLPPGLARLATKPAATGSPLRAMTMGMVDVARLTASIAGVATAKITSTLSLTSSSARPGTRSAWPSAVRNSILTVRPSTYPRSRSPWRKASTIGSSGVEIAMSMPTTGILFGCCAHAVVERQRDSMQRQSGADVGSPDHLIRPHPLPSLPRRRRRVRRSSSLALARDSRFPPPPAGEG